MLTAHALKLMKTVEVHGANFIGIDTVTDVKLKGGKKNPMQGRVQKLTVGSSVIVFSNTNKNGYEAMVKRRLAKEGQNPEKFELSPLAWGQRIPETPFIEHKGNFYMQVIFQKAGDVIYLLDGKQIDKSEIIGLPEVKPSADSQGGLEDKVIVRAYKCESIKAVRANGQVVQF